MTAQDLKNSILQLAVQGKLVPQDSNDEPASELLKRIKAEKERLIKEEKVKKEKPLSPITDDEIPFDIPESWQWVRLGNCTSYDDTKDKVGCSNINPDDWSLDLEDIEKDTGRIVNYCKAEKRNIKGDKVRFYKGQILYSKLRPYLKKILVAPDNGICTPELVPFFAYGGIDANYLVSVLKSPYVDNSINSVTYGEKMPRVGTKTMINLIIPLPPLAEQKRIVAKIEELMPLVEEYGKAEERLTALNAEFPDKLRKSILQQAIQGKLTERDPADEPASELLKRIGSERQSLQKSKKAKKSQATEKIDENELTFDLPDNWSWVKLGWICQKVGAGSTPKGGATVYVSNGIKFLREQNVHDDGLHLEGVVFIDEKTNNQKSGSIVQPQDILMNITGGSIGRNALVPDDFDIANVNQHVLIIRLVDKSLRKYLHYCLCAPFVLNQMFSKQIGDKPGLSATKVENFVIPLPPLAEQQRIVERVNELLAVCNELK